MHPERHILLIDFFPGMPDYDLFDFTPTLFPALNFGKTIEALRLLLLFFSTRRLLFDGAVDFEPPSMSISRVCEYHKFYRLSNCPTVSLLVVRFRNFGSLC